MQSWAKRILCCAALALPATATAQSSFKQFDLCGGTFPGSSAFGFCAAANVAVQLLNGSPTVTIQVWNESGNQGLGVPSGPRTTLIGVGLTNIVPSTVDIVAGSLKVTGPCFTNPHGCDVSQYWGYGNNWTLGGVMVDMLTYSAGSGDITSNCDPTNPNLTRPGYLITSCDRSGPQFVTISFKVTKDFDLADGGDLFLKGKQQGTGNTTSCVTSNGPAECTEVTATPEPGTLLLLGSGLSGFTGVGFFRRRRKKDDEA